MSQLTPDDACRLLGVTLETNDIGLSAARKAAARRVHPDRHIGASPAFIEASEEQMKRVNEAYDLLRRRAQVSGLAGHHSEAAKTEAPAGPTVTCAVCELPQAEPPATSIYACTKCRSPLFRATCGSCDQSTNVWGVDAWRCTCGKQNRNTEVLIRSA
jgi:hypothetical protein